MSDVPSSSYRSIVIVVGIIGIVAGIVMMLAPYSRAVGDTAASVRCEAPVVGAFGSDGPDRSGDASAGGVTAAPRLDCAGDARSRLVLGAAFLAGGAAAIALIVRKTRLPDAGLPKGPVPPSWEATGEPPPV